MAILTFPNAISVQGTATAERFSGPMARTNLDTEQKIYNLPILGWRVHDAIQTHLPTTGAVDDLGITTGTWSTGVPHLRTAELNGGAGNGTYYARQQFQLPENYVAGQDGFLRFHAGMLTSVAATTFTVDGEVYRSDKDTTTGGSDLITTSATSANSTTFTSYDFALSGATLSPGDILDIRIAVVATSATASTHFGAIAAVHLVLPVKG